MAPTFLDIAGVAKEEHPAFFDGRSLLEQWECPSIEYPGAGQGNGYEVLNIEFRGGNAVGAPGGVVSYNSTYKSLRIVGEEFSFLYTHWCYTNEIELYDTLADPYEIKNLARDPDPQTQKLLDRMNAMLLVQKSCAKDVCQDPWEVLLAGSSLPAVTTLKETLDPMYDEHFASFPRVNITPCLGYQDSAVEAPFWPPSAQEALYEGKRSTASLGPSFKFPQVVPGNDGPEGGFEQRHSTLDKILGSSRPLTQEELDRNQEGLIRSSGRTLGSNEEV